MKRVIAFLFLAVPCIASGPKYIGSKVDPATYQEFQNVYHDIANPSITIGTASTMTVTQLNVGTMTVTGTVNTPSINGTFVGLGRNRIINGDMLIDQRNAGALVTVNGAGSIYGCDRWAGFGTAAAGVFKTQQLTTTPPTGFTTYTHTTVTTADATPAAGSTYGIYQAIEGNNFYDFLFGTANARSVVVTFWVRSNLTGQFGGALKNYNASRDYAFTYTINAANTWEKKTVTVAGDTTGTWQTDTQIGIFVILNLGCGSNFLTTAGSWGTTNIDGATGDTKLITSTSNTLDFTGFQFEMGTVATSHEYMPFPSTLLQCQKYCAVLAGAVNPHILVTGQAFSTTQADIPVRWPTTMRVTPTVTIRNPTHFQLTTAAAALTSLTAASASGANNQTCELDLTVAAVLVAGNATDLYSVNLDGTILADADY